MKSLSLILAATLLAIAVSAQELTWQQLVQHPEMWPAQCHLKHEFEFRSGAKLKAGDTVDVLEIKSNQIEVGTTSGRSFAFDVKPDETDVLEAARTAYAKLTPRQRALTYDQISKDETLWPYHLTLKDTLQLSNGHRVNKGDQVIFKGFKGKQLEVGAVKYGTWFEVDPQETDLMEQTRQFVELPNHAPSRIIAELQPFLINSSTAKADPLNTNNPPRYLVFIRAAHSCPMSQRFLPKLVKFCDEMKQKHSDFQVIYLSCDGELPAMEKFSKDVGFSWPTVTYQNSGYLSLLIPHFQALMPQFTVITPRGQVLISGVGEAENGVVQATSADGNSSKTVLNGISAAAALDQFGQLLAKDAAGQ